MQLLIGPAACKPRRSPRSRPKEKGGWISPAPSTIPEHLAPHLSHPWDCRMKCFHQRKKPTQWNSQGCSFRVGLLYSLPPDERAALYQVFQQSRNLIHLAFSCQYRIPADAQPQPPVPPTTNFRGRPSRAPSPGSRTSPWPAPARWPGWHEAHSKTPGQAGGPCRGRSCPTCNGRCDVDGTDARNALALGSLLSHPSYASRNSCHRQPPFGGEKDPLSYQSLCQRSKGRTLPPNWSAGKGITRRAFRDPKGR